MLRFEGGVAVVTQHRQLPHILLFFSFSFFFFMMTTEQVDVADLCARLRSFEGYMQEADPPLGDDAVLQHRSFHTGRICTLSLSRN